MSLSNCTVFSFDQYIDKNWKQSSSPVKAQVATRLGYLALAGGMLVTSTIDTALGIICALGTILSGGLNKPAFEQCFQFLEGTNKMLAIPFTFILKTLNPQAQVDTTNTSGLFGEISCNLGRYARKLAQSDHLFKRHVASRLTYLLYAVVSVITRIIDGVIGVIAALFSLLTLGQYKALNDWAYVQLLVTALVDDLVYGIVHTINPWADPEL